MPSGNSVLVFAISQRQVFAIQPKYLGTEWNFDLQRDNNLFFGSVFIQEYQMLH